MRLLHPRFADSLLIRAEQAEYDYGLHSITEEEGNFIWTLIRENGYRKSIEVGCAGGVSSLYICDAVCAFPTPSHTMIDPYQSTAWKGLGVRNLQARGIAFFDLVEEPSEIALPRLVDRKEVFDFGFIDGWHTFDHALLDFFYLNRLIRVGGTIAFDDADWPSITKLLRYLRSYPAYELILPPGPASDSCRPSVRHRLFNVLCRATKLIPPTVRKAVFSDQVLSGEVVRSNPSIVALRKVAEDKRNYDWFDPF